MVSADLHLCFYFLGLLIFYINNTIIKFVYSAAHIVFNSATQGHSNSVYQ